jgi:hypothetical protein
MNAPLDSRTPTVRIFGATRCPVCGVVVERPDGAGRPGRWCSEAHRLEAHRLRPLLRAVTRIVVRMQAGMQAEGRYAGLIREAVQREVALLRAEQQAARLPGGGL